MVQRQQGFCSPIKELGDWQAYGRGALAPLLNAPFIGNR